MAVPGEREAAMKFLTPLLLAAAVAVVPGCRDDNPTDVIVGNGTVILAQVEGGCWLVRTDSGATYQALNLPAEFQKPNLRVHFTLREKKDAVSICMSGVIAEVISMKRL